MSSARDVTDATFASEVLESPKPVMVDFWAEWCGPCRKVSPLLEEIASEMSDKLDIVKLDIDANPETTRSYRIMSVPTMMIFKGGRPVKSVIGAQPKGSLVRSIEAALSDA